MPDRPIDRLDSALFALQQQISDCVPSPVQEQLQRPLNAAITAASDLREELVNR